MEVSSEMPLVGNPWEKDVGGLHRGDKYYGEARTLQDAFVTQRDADMVWYRAREREWALKEAEWLEKWNACLTVKYSHHWTGLLDHINSLKTIGMVK